MRFLIACLFSLAPVAALAATCITDKSAFPGYKAGLAADARGVGIGAAGLQALSSAAMSDITTSAFPPSHSLT